MMVDDEEDDEDDEDALFGLVLHRVCARR